jgi:hypothetical protein
MESDRVYGHVGVLGERYNRARSGMEYHRRLPQISLEESEITDNKHRMKIRDGGDTGSVVFVSTFGETVLDRQNLLTYVGSAMRGQR